MLEKGRGHILLVGLAQRLVCVLCLFLEKLESPGEGLVLCAVLHTLVGGLLVVGNGGLQLLDLALQQAVLVGQRGDLLLLGEVLLLKGLDLALELFDLGCRLVGLQAELVHFLQCPSQPTNERSRMGGRAAESG